MNNGIIYVRVSSDEQVSGTSLDFQKEECIKYCKNKGINVVKVFREEGESAKTCDRKELLNALEFCRQNKKSLSAFVVLKVNRFARNTEDHFKVRKLLLDYGITLHSVTEPIGNSPTEKFIETILAASSEFDNALRKKSCTDGMMKRIDQGIYPWKCPIGYKSLYCKKRGLKKTKPDIPDEDIFPIIQKGLQHIATTGLYSKAELGRMLDEWGLEKIRGKKICPQLVSDITGKYLKFYAGILTNPWTGEEKEGLHQPMITKEEYYQILYLRSGKKETKERTPKNSVSSDFPLRGFVQCGACRIALTSCYSKGRSKKYPYYLCRNKNCIKYGKSIKKETIESDFFKYLEQLTPKEEFLKFYIQEIKSVFKKKTQQHTKQVKNYQNKITSLTDKKAKIFDLFEEGIYSKEEFKIRKEKIENEIAVMTISRNDENISKLDVECTLKYMKQFLGNLPRQWIDTPTKILPWFYGVLFPKGISYTPEHGFRTSHLALILEQNKVFIYQKSTGVDPTGDFANQICLELAQWDAYFRKRKTLIHYS